MKTSNENFKTEKRIIELERELRIAERSKNYAGANKIKNTIFSLSESIIDI